MKICCHGDLVPVDLNSIRKGASIEVWDWTQTRQVNIWICGRVLHSRLIRVMTKI